MPKIEKIFAFIVEDKDSDDEGIVTTLMKDVYIPLVCGNMKRVDDLSKIAQKISNERGKKIKVLEFSVRKTIKTIMPLNN